MTYVHIHSKPKNIYIYTHTYINLSGAASVLYQDVAHGYTCDDGDHDIKQELVAIMVFVWVSGSAPALPPRRASSPTDSEHEQS